jgi:phosphonopyruvate decarboxylase
MRADRFIEILGCDFFTGVPDSQLAPFCNHLMSIYGISDKHIIAANEGNAVAIAAGHHLATGRIPCVYLQNSGIGNIVNPVASLLHKKVYNIPCIFVIGWRGEPGIKDEPQHIFQGEITMKLLEDLDIDSIIVDKEMTEEELMSRLSTAAPLLNKGSSIAIVVRKGALSDVDDIQYSNSNKMLREDIIRSIAEFAEGDLIVSTTGKSSRELFEIREQKAQPHCYDFLTVGSMGHSSSIALGIALARPDQRIWCIDGDGAALMHLGAMAIIGAVSPSNMIHVVINNEAHETVGGMPTVANHTNLITIAVGCGYPEAVCVEDHDGLISALHHAKQAHHLHMIEVKAGLGARADLGRPTTTAEENKRSFMSYINSSCL